MYLTGEWVPVLPRFFSLIKGEKLEESKKNLKTLLNSDGLLGMLPIEQHEECDNSKKDKKNDY